MGIRALAALAVVAACRFDPGGVASDAVMADARPDAGAPSVPWKQLAVGGQFACGVRTDGTLWCWGDDAFGQLGDGQTTMQPSPIQVGGDTDWRHVTSGHAHACALKADHSMWCWGDNSLGQLGLGSTAFGAPTLVP